MKRLNKIQYSMDYLKLFDTEQDYNAYINDDPLLPNVSYVIESDVVHYNPKSEDEDTYLTFEALEDGTFSFTRDGLSYSTDEGQTWTALAANTQTPTVLSGETIMFKGQMRSYRSDGIGKFSSTGRYKIRGNIMSLLFGDDYVGQDDLTGYNYAFMGIFASSDVVDSSGLLLPALNLTESCYETMFWGCTRLTNAPVLPATTAAPYCYDGMFRGCTSLTSAPALPATTVAPYCYYGMFYGCTSLTTAPTLPAETLTDRCYADMFNGCSSLNYVKAMFITTVTYSHTNSWLNGVASTGTFVKNADATWDDRGGSGVPYGWTIETE